MDKQILGNRINEKRKQLGLTQKQLATELNVSDKAVSKWERGLNYPDFELLEKIAQALNISLAELLNIQDTAITAAYKELSIISAEEKNIIKKELKNTIKVNIAFLVFLFLSLNLGFRFMQLNEMHSLVPGTLIAMFGVGGGCIIGNSIRVLKKLELL